LQTLCFLWEEYVLIKDRWEIRELAQVLGKLLLIVSLGASAPACGSPVRVLDSSADGVAKKGQGAMVSDQSLPVNRRFKTLDAYLAYLEQYEAPIDKPWYKQVRPGIYELQTGNLRILGTEGEQKRTFTREDLERMFGFR
jgi:hypothetical protein